MNVDVILNAAQDLVRNHAEILRCARNDWHENSPGCFVTRPNTALNCPLEGLISHNRIANRLDNQFVVHLNKENRS